MEQENERFKQEIGDCYVVHAKMMFDIYKDNGIKKIKPVRLVHGEVFHPITDWHGHCWIEIDDQICIDVANGLNIVMRKEQYYEKGKVKNVKRYTFKQMARNLLSTGHYGDWRPDEDLFYGDAK